MRNEKQNQHISARYSAGVPARKIADELREKFGLHLTETGVKSRIERLQKAGALERRKPLSDSEYVARLLAKGCQNKQLMRVAMYARKLEEKTQERKI